MEEACRKNYCSCISLLNGPSAARCPASSWSCESINQEPGFIWKVWTESEKNHEAGGIYLLKTALAYLNKHTARLKSLGVDEVIGKVFDVTNRSPR